MTRGVLRSPIILAIFVLLTVYGLFFSTGQLYANTSPLYQVTVYALNCLSQYVIAYLFLGRWLHMTLIRNIPVFWSITLFWCLIYIPEYTVGQVFHGPGVAQSDALLHYTSSCVLALIGSLFGIAIFKSRFEALATNEMATIPIWRPVSTSLEPLQYKLPASKRGVILRLHAENQYVNVVTDKGQHLVRATLKEAIEGIHARKGLRVHRSLWIREDEIVELFYDNGNPRILDTQNLNHPVSRKMVATIKDIVEVKNSGTPSRELSEA